MYNNPFLFLVIEYEEYKASFCIEDGHRGEIMITRSETANIGFHTYYLPEISVIPPIQTQSCHIDLYYNGNVFVDTFYLFKDRPPTSRFENWTIQGQNIQFRNSDNTNILLHDVILSYNMDHYHISLTVPYVENNSDSKSEGKHRQYKQLECIH